MRRIVQGSSDHSGRGAAALEFALIAPILIVLVFGIVEYGLVFRKQLTISNAVQQAGRVASSLGNDTQADYETLLAVAQGVEALPDGIVRQVYLFEANSAGNPKSGCPGSACNVYTYVPGFWASPPCDWSPCPNLDEGGTLGGSWTADDRDVALPGLDDVGLRLFYSHSSVVGGLVPITDAPCTSPPTACWETEAIFRMEPKVFEP